MTRQEVAGLVALAVANHPHLQERDLTTTAVLWMDALGDLPFPVAKASLLKVMATSPYWPSVAQLRDAAESINPQSNLPSPEAAWDEVARAIKRWGYTKKPEWSHPAVGNAAEGMYGSWVALCQSCTVDSMRTDRAHFLRMYDSLTKRERDNATLPAAVKGLLSQLVSDKRALPAPVDDE